MIYILIFAFAASSNGAIAHIEFNTKEACLAAADQYQKTAKTFTKADVIFCAAKGERK